MPGLQVLRRTGINAPISMRPSCKINFPVCSKMSLALLSSHCDNWTDAIEMVIKTVKETMKMPSARAQDTVMWYWQKTVATNRNLPTYYSPFAPSLMHLKRHHTVHLSRRHASYTSCINKGNLYLYTMYIGITVQKVNSVVPFQVQFLQGRKWLIIQKELKNQPWKRTVFVSTVWDSAHMPRYLKIFKLLVKFW